MKITLNMQFVLNIISLLAFIMSTTSWVLTFVQRRIKIFFQVIDYCQHNNACQFYVMIQNNSSLPLSIPYICINDKMCQLEPVVVRIENHTEKFSTPQFPLNIAPKAGVNAYLEFRGCGGISLGEGKNLDFQIHTNYRQLRKSVSLGEKSHYVNIC